MHVNKIKTVVFTNADAMYGRCVLYLTNEHPIEMYCDCPNHLDQLQTLLTSHMGSAQMLYYPGSTVWCTETDLVLKTSLMGALLIKSSFLGNWTLDGFHRLTRDVTAR